MEQQEQGFAAVGSGLRETLAALGRPFLDFLVFLKYHDIWRVRAALKGAKSGSRCLGTVYGGYFQKRGSFIGLGAQFAGPICFPHGVLGVFISNQATIGKNCVIFQQVTIGSNTLADGKRNGSPVIGDNVYIGAGAKIIGQVRIGNNCRIGAGAVVYEDMPDNSVAVCAPTRILQREQPLDNRYITRLGGCAYYFQDGRYLPFNENNVSENSSPQ